MAGLYRLSIMDICCGLCNIPHGPLCDCWRASLFFPGTRKRNCKKILLAINHRCNCRGWPWHHPGQPILIPFAPHKGWRECDGVVVKKNKLSSYRRRPGAIVFHNIYFYEIKNYTSSPPVEEYAAGGRWSLIFPQNTYFPAPVIARRSRGNPVSPRTQN